MPVIGSRADYGKWATLACANGAESVQIIGQNRQHITLLRFVAPNLQGRQAVLFQRHITQPENRAAPCIVYQFGERVGQPARAHIVNRNNRIGIAQLPAAVYHFLRTAFHFGVAALHRVKIQIRAVAACCHRRSRAAAQANQHPRAAQLHQQRACGDFVFVRLRRLDVAQAARNHNRLVVAIHLLVKGLLKGAEIAQQVGATKFVVKRCAADGGFKHNVQRG